MAKPIIPLETRTKAIELVLGGMRRKQAAERLGAGIGAVHNWVTAYQRGRHGRAATQEQERRAERRGRNAGDGNDDTAALCRRVEELELENALMREVVEAGLAMLTGHGSSVTPYGMVMAGALISALPLLIVFFFVQKRFVEGIAMTGMK